LVRYPHLHARIKVILPIFIHTNMKPQLIMTTNCRESLDRALVRPGRCDLQLELTYASKEQIRDMFLKIYTHRRTDKPSEYTPQELLAMAVRFENAIPAGLFTPAELQQHILIYRVNPEGAVQNVHELFERVRQEDTGFGERLVHLNTDGAADDATVLVDSRYWSSPNTSSADTPHSNAWSQQNTGLEDSATAGLMTLGSSDVASVDNIDESDVGDSFRIVISGAASEVSAPTGPTGPAQTTRSGPPNPVNTIEEAQP
jgi:hypothetical protein